MSEQASNDLYEADIAAVLETIWNAKFIVIAFLIGGLFFSGFLISRQKLEFKSSIPLEVYNNPPFLSKAEVLADFEFVFKDPNVFEMWKATTANTVLKADDLNQIKTIEGLTFSRSKNDRSVAFTNKGIEIKSNDVAFFTAVNDYRTFVEDTLTERYIAGASDRLALFKDNSALFLKKLNSNDTLTTLKYLAGLRLYIESDKEKRPLMIPVYPTEPAKMGAAKSMILIVTVSAAGALGIMFALLYASIRRQVEKRSASPA